MVEDGEGSGGDGGRRQTSHSVDKAVRCDIVVLFGEGEGARERERSVTAAASATFFPRSSRLSLRSEAATCQSEPPAQTMPHALGPSQQNNNHHQHYYQPLHYIMQVQNPWNRLLVTVDRHKLLNHSVEFRSCFRKTFVEIRGELNCVHVAVTVLVEFSNHPVVLLFRPRSTFLPESATGFTQGLQLFLTDTPAVVEIKVIVDVLESTDAIRFLVRF